MDKPFEPKCLKRWTLPQDYAGAVWPAYYSAGVGQSRDSSHLEQSNFAAMLEALGGEDEDETVLVVHERHWAVGWVEWIAIHQDNEAALRVADKLCAKLEDYPMLDEDDVSRREWEAAADYWDSLSPRQKVQEAMDARKRFHWLTKEPVWQFGRWDFSDLASAGGSIAEYLYERLLQE